MGLFGPSPPIDREEFEWLLACFAWIDRTLGAKDRADGFVPELVLPTDPDLLKASTAPQLFEVVKRKAGLEHWECRLEKGEARREPVDIGLVGGFTQSSNVLGTFSLEGNTPVVCYDPALLRNPDALIATFAHELAHLLIHTLGMPPGGETLEEHATDCMAVYLGFGVFLANDARNFSQFSEAGMHGWSSEASGYLSENALVTALVLFERHFDKEECGADALKDYLRPVHRKADRYLKKRHPHIRDELAGIDLSVWASS
ncbi:MAG: hypothetical protein ABJK59_08100 [Erythrobacter sp.]|uniref:hypothetical protein n=1 Tax=Erythrobacter sp. TaxID=1042 RepID=UPI00329927EA